MVAKRLGKNCAETVPQFAIVGEESDHGVSHVGLLPGLCGLDHGMKIELFQMTDELNVGLAESAKGSEACRMNAHLVGWSSSCDDDDFEGIDAWLDAVRKSAIHVEYVAFPAWGDKFEKQGAGFIYDKRSGKRIARRYSCASFVAHCYREGADIDLVVAEELLPMVNLETIKQ